MEILGLVDALESLVLDSFKVPLSGKILIDEEKILTLVDKIRLVCQKGEDFAKRSIEKDIRDLKSSRKTSIAPADGLSTESAPAPSSTTTSAAAKGQMSKDEAEAKAVEIIQQAYQLAKEVRKGADQYADEVLANLEATSTRILRTIRNGRGRLQTGRPDEKSATTTSTNGVAAEAAERTESKTPVAA